jgi:hypothetical protein
MRTLPDITDVAHQLNGLQQALDRVEMCFDWYLEASLPAQDAIDTYTGKPFTETEVERRREQLLEALASLFNRPPVF